MPSFDKKTAIESDAPRWWDGVLCGAFVLLAVVSAWPFAEMGFDDDWSYIRTAQEYALTGHMIYNGWANAMLGWVVPCSALFIKVFGFSFTAARLPTFVCAFLSVWVFHAVLRRCGISRRSAIFGALTLGLSPIFISLAPSLMSDVSGLLVIVLCFLMCQRALGARSDAAALGWLVSASMVNVAGGTVRQIAWLGALVVVPCTAWLIRRRRGAIATGLLCWCLSVVAIGACLLWWSHQPYSVPDAVSLKPGPLLEVGRYLFCMIFCFAFLLFPLLAAWLMRLHAFAWREHKVAIVLCVLVVAYGVRQCLRGNIDHAAVPWGIGDMLAALGFLPRGNWLMLGIGPASIGPWTRLVLSLSVMISIILFIDDLVRAKKVAAPAAEAQETTSWNTLFILFGPYCLAYCTLLLPRTFLQLVFDRYFLGLMPVAIVFLLKLYKERIADKLPVLSYAVLAGLALFSIAGTHDWFAVNRARVRAVQMVTATGVPVTSIEGGMEQDGWTQIVQVGYLNDQRIRVPANVYRNVSKGNTLPERCTLWFDDEASAIHPEYFVVLSKLSCFTDSQFGEVGYSAWMPPFHRSIYIQRRR